MVFENIRHTKTSRRKVTALCVAKRLDYAFLPSNTTWATFRLLVVDMDSTLITTECIDELATLAGKCEEVAAITHATMTSKDLDFAESLRSRVSLLTGLPRDALARVYQDRVRLTEGAEGLIRSAKANGLSVALVSGGFDYFSSRLQHLLGLEYSLANTLLFNGDVLSGKVAEPIVDGFRKAGFVSELVDLTRSKPSETIVIGDGANDLLMMQDAGLSIAYHAKQVVKDFADCSVEYGNLEVIDDWLSNSSSTENSPGATLAA